MFFPLDQGSWMVTWQQQWVENRHTSAGQELLTPVQLVWGTWPQVQSWGRKLGTERDNAAAGLGGVCEAPTHEQPPFHPFIPIRHGCGVALHHLQGNVLSLCKRRKEHSSLNESDCSSPAQPLPWKSQTREQCEKCDSLLNKNMLQWGSVLHGHRALIDIKYGKEVFFIILYWPQTLGNASFRFTSEPLVQDKKNLGSGNL